VKKDGGQLATIDGALLFQSYMAGYVPSQLDATAYLEWKDKVVPRATYPNMARWLDHMASFTPSQRSAWPANPTDPSTQAPVSAPKPGSLSKAQPPVIAKKEEDDDDDVDLFGDDDDAEVVIEVVKEKSMKEKLEEKKQAALERLAKKEAKQKTLCSLEIKPWDAEQDLHKLFAKLKTDIVMDGLKWSENCALKDVAFGIKKILLTAVISVNLSMDGIIEDILEGPMADEIQSMEMTSMSLL